MKIWQDKGMTPQVAFTKVFEREWKASTFGDNNYVWTQTPVEVMSAAVKKGRKPGGEWSKLTASYGKRKRAAVVG